MRILYLGNNRVGYEVLRWLKSQGADIVGLVVHPPEKQMHGEEIIATADLKGDSLIYSDTLRDPKTLLRIQSLGPELGLSVFFGYILKQDLLDLLPSGCINLHPAYLPHNRGFHPNVWNIVEDTPAGATMHYIDAGVDTGDMISQKRVNVEPTDTGESLYHRLESTCIELFTETWPAIQSDTAHRVPQDLGSGSFHYRRDLQSLDVIDLDKTYVARDLINILRARTFPPHRGAYFEHDGSRIYMRLQLAYEGQLED